MQPSGKQIRILVTGARGLIGRQVASSSLPRGAELILTSRSPVDGYFGESHIADLTQPGEAAALVRFVRPTHIIHSAWETKPPTYWEDPINWQWVEATAQMATALAEVRGQRFIQVGSCMEYDWRQQVFAEGASEDGPGTLYGRAKLAAFERICSAASGLFAAVEARVFFVYGPGEHADRLVPTICRTHLQGAVPAISSGRQKRDFLYSRDVARALLALAFSNTTGVVNVGSGTAVSLSKIATILAELAGARETGLGTGPDRPGEPPLIVANVQKLRQTGWSAATSLREGLAETLEWWREQVATELQ